ERRLKKVDVEPGALVQALNSAGRCKPAQPSVSGQTANHRAVLLLDPGLIVFVISARAGPFDAVLVAIALKRFIHEGAVVIGIKAAQSERKALCDGVDPFDHQTLFPYHECCAFGPAAVNTRSRSAYARSSRLPSLRHSVRPYRTR